MATMEMSEEDKAQMRVKGNVRDLGTGDEGRQPVHEVRKADCPA